MLKTIKRLKSELMANAKHPSTITDKRAYFIPLSLYFRTKMDSPARRIVLRMHSNMFERYVEITNSWFQRCNYCDLEDVAHDVYDWSDRHFVHVGGENADRWHLIVDMEKDQLSSLDPQQIPYEVYRVTSNQDGELSVGRQ